MTLTIAVALGAFLWLSHRLHDAYVHAVSREELVQLRGSAQLGQAHEGFLLEPPQVDRDLMLVYSPLMVVPFREWLIGRGIQLVEVPEEEFESMGGNVLAVAPRKCIMMSGNPITKARLEAAGAEVYTYTGEEISAKGCGGPTCLTRPLERVIE